MSEDPSRYRQAMFIFTLGTKDEIVPHDFTSMGWEAEHMMKRLNDIVFKELMDRYLLSIWQWSTRATNVFANNGLKTVGQIVGLSPAKVNSLVGCGLAVKSEIYYTFNDEFNMKLYSWAPYEGFKRYGL